MKAIQHIFGICLMLSATISVAQVPVYPTLYGESILTSGKTDKGYHPLYEVTDLTKSELISIWDTTDNSWNPFITTSNRHSADCSKTLSKSFDLLGIINDTDSFTYVNNRLVSRANIDQSVIARYRYVGTRTVPDTLIWDDVAANEGLIYTFTYDANNLPASVAIKKRTGTVLSDSLRATYRHNTVSNLTAFRAEIYNGTRWIFDEQDTVIYNADNKIIKVNSIQKTDTLEDVYNYDVNKRLTSAVFYEIVNGQPIASQRALVPANRYFYNGYPTEIIAQQTDGVKWDTLLRETFTYNGAFSMTNLTLQQYTDRKFVNALKVDYTYCGQRVGTTDPRLHEKTLVLSPNPTTEQLTVRLEAENPTMTVQIFDNLGKNVLQTPSNQMQTTLSVGHLSSGIYIVRVQSGTDWAVKKFVKM